MRRIIIARLFRVEDSYQYIASFRNEQDAELKTKMATIEDLHGRLKSNVDSVSSLNNQVIILKPFEIQKARICLFSLINLYTRAQITLL